MRPTSVHDKLSLQGPFSNFRGWWVTQVEARAALGDYRGAAEALEAGGQRDPGFAASADYQTLARQLSRVVIRA
jgi:hypothetical protein